jgi:hypothetical protein
MWAQVPHGEDVQVPGGEQPEDEEVLRVLFVLLRGVP